MTNLMLAPAAALVLWTMIVLLWMTATRFPALMKLDAGGVASAAPGGRYQDVEHRIDPRVNWKSHNYTHLMEQPTVFYPAVIILHLADAATPLNLTLAWSYVGLRIAHSLWQALVNRIPVRIALFSLSSVCLLALAVNAARVTLGV
ncbi:MAG: MAPEG family protein [Sphingomonadaceae bacterium]